MTFIYFVSYCYKDLKGHGFSSITVVQDHQLVPDDLSKIVKKLCASENYSSVAILNFILYPTV